MELLICKMISFNLPKKYASANFCEKLECPQYKIIETKITEINIFPEDYHIKREEQIQKIRSVYCDKCPAMDLEEFLSNIPFS